MEREIDFLDAHVRVHQALSDRNRMRIIKLLSGGELCACKINEYFRITQPTLSHHMRVLCEAGLVLARRDGIWMHYRINKQTMQMMSEGFDFLAHSKEGVNEDIQSDCCKKPQEQTSEMAQIK